MKNNAGKKYKTGWTPPPMELCGTGPVPEYRIEKRHTDVDLLKVNGIGDQTLKGIKKRLKL